MCRELCKPLYPHYLSNPIFCQPCSSDTTCPLLRGGVRGKRVLSKESDVKDSQVLISLFQPIYPSGGLIAAEGCLRAYAMAQW